MPQKEWFKYRIPLTCDGDLKDLEGVNTEEELKKILVRTLPNDLYILSEKLDREDKEVEDFWVNKIFKKELTEENIKNFYSEIKFILKEAETIRIKDFRNYPTLSNCIDKQNKFIFEHNMKILESKKDKIIEYFSKQGVDSTIHLKRCN